jgi:hypothetical protein
MIFEGFPQGKLLGFGQGNTAFLSAHAAS